MRLECKQTSRIAPYQSDGLTTQRLPEIARIGNILNPQFMRRGKCLDFDRALYSVLAPAMAGCHTLSRPGVGMDVCLRQRVQRVWGGEKLLHKFSRNGGRGDGAILEVFDLGRVKQVAQVCIARSR
jgi:hypothetical protein